MAYERTTIEVNPTSQPSIMPEMREERVVDPYRASTARNKVTQTTQSSPPLGQIATNVDTVSVEVPSAPEETVTLSPQMAALARKEQKFRQQQLDLKKRTEELDAEKAVVAELKALKAKLDAKDYSGIEDLVKYDEYTQYLIEKDSNLSPEQIALNKLKEEFEADKTARREEVKRSFDAAVNQRRLAVTELVKENPEFSSIKELKAEEAVVQLILDAWEHDNVELSPEDAARDVEKELLERAKRWTQLTKIKPAVETAPVDDKKTLPPLKAPIKTLTNNMAAPGDVKRPVKSFQHMTSTERYAEARRRAEENLKQGIR